MKLLEYEKAQYQLNSQMNKRMAQTSRVASSAAPSIAGGVLKELVNEREQQLQARLDGQLLECVIADAQDLQTFLDVTRNGGSDYTLQKLADRLIDSDLTVESRMHYAKLLAMETEKQYRSMSTVFKQLDQSIASMTENEHQHFAQLAGITEKTANEIGHLQQNLATTDYQLTEFHQKFLRNVDSVGKKMSEHLQGITQVKLTQTQLLAGQSQLFTTLSGMNNLIYALVGCELEKVDVSQYTNAPHVQQLHTEFLELKQQAELGNGSVDAVLNKKIELQKAIHTVEEQRAEYKSAILTTRSLASGISNVAILCGNPQLAMQIDVLSKAAVTLTETTLGLVGSTLVSSMNPVVAVMNITGIAASIFNVFGQKQNQDESHIVILEAIKQLAKNVVELRREMHERFDEVLRTMDRNHLALLDRFSELAHDADLTLTKIRNIYVDMHQHFNDIESIQSEIFNQLSKVHHALLSQDYRQDLRSLESDRNFIVANPRDDAYKERFNRLITIGCNHSVTNQITSPMSIVDMPLHPDNFIHLANYFSSSVSSKLQLSNQVGGIGDPKTVMLSTLIALSQNYRKFPIPNNPDMNLRVTNVAISQFKQLESMLQGIGWLIVQTRNPKILSELIEQFRVASKNLSLEMTTQLLAIEREKQQLIESTAHPEIDKLQKSQHEAFTQNRIEHSTFDWFNIKLRSVSRSHHKKTWRCSDTTTDSPYSQSKKVSYLDSLEQQYNIQRAAVLERYKKSVNLRLENRLHLFAADKIATHHATGFILPIDSGMPVLPAPDPLFHQPPEFMRDLLLAQSLGIGLISLRYQIIEQEFVLQIGFMLATEHEQLQPYSIAAIKMPYDPGIYSAGEAVWNFWMGGELQTDRKGVYFHIASGSRFQWHRLVESQTQHQLAVTVGTIACQGGAFGHKNGEFDYVDNAGYVPGQPVLILDARSQFQNLYVQNLETLNTKNLEEIQKVCRQKKQVFEQQVLAQLSSMLVAHSHTSLGRACYQYESAIRELYGYLSFAYHDELARTDRPLHQWFVQRPLSLAKLQEYYTGTEVGLSPNELHAENERALPVLSDILAGLVQQYSDPAFALHDMNYQMLTITLDNIELFLHQYQDYAVREENVLDVVEENKLHWQILIRIADEICKSDDSARIGVLNSIQTSFSNYLNDQPKQLQTRFVQRLQEAFAGGGISVEWTSSSQLKLTTEYAAKQRFFKTPAAEQASSSSSTNSSTYSGKHAKFG